MKFSGTPFVVRVGMPLLFIVGICLFFHGMAPEYWLIALPLFIIAIFMSTLAEIEDLGHRIRIERLWNRVDVPKEDVRNVTDSFLEGIRVISLRQFVFPWGRVYFVADWSKFGVIRSPDGRERVTSTSEAPSIARIIIESTVVAASGFFAARAIMGHVHVPISATSPIQWGAILLAFGLCIVFFVTRRSKAGIANIALFIAAFIVVFAFL